MVNWVYEIISHVLYPTVVCSRQSALQFPPSFQFDVLKSNQFPN